MTRLASKELFSPSIKIHGEVGRAEELSAPRWYLEKYYMPAMFEGTKDQTLLKR